MSTLKERIQMIMEEKSWDIATLARVAEVSHSAASQWIGRGSKPIHSIKNAEAASRLEEETRYKALWIATGKGPRYKSKEFEGTGHGEEEYLKVMFSRRDESVEDEGSPIGSLHEEADLGDGYIRIRESMVRFSAGHGHAPIYDETQDYLPRIYRRSWFQQEGINPERTKGFKVHGDSMYPFLHDGDSVLVNLAENNVISGKVYALRYGDELRIKRVYKKLDGGLVLHSENPEFRPRDEELSPEVVQEHITIIGRVRDKSGTGGL